MSQEFSSKQSYEEYYLSFGFADKIGSATIASFSFTAIDLFNGTDALATILDASLATISGSDVRVWTKGGTDQHDYLITCKIGANDGTHYELEGILPIRDIVTPSLSMLIIEDGSLSTPSANSYVTVAEVDTYCRQMGYTSWFTLSNEDKETAILRAMTFIDSQNFKGHKTGWDNPLAFPRIGVYGDVSHAFNYPEDYEYWSEYPIDAIPKAVKRATCEAAYLESTTPGTLLADRSTNIKREKVDVLEVEYFSAQPSQTVFSKVLALLREVLADASGSGGVISVLRT